MTSTSPARTTFPWIARLLAAGLLVVTAAIGYQLLASASSAPGLAMEVLPGDRLGSLDYGDGVLPPDHLGSRHRGDGALPLGTTVFDNQMPAIGRLAPGFLRALRRAADDAADD